MEERLKFLSSGDKPRKNKDVMDEVMKELKADGLYFDANGKTGGEETKADKKEAKKRSKPEAAADLSDEDERPKKKKKKSKD